MFNNSRKQKLETKQNVNKNKQEARPNRLECGKILCLHILHIKTKESGEREREGGLF